MEDSNIGVKVAIFYLLSSILSALFLTGERRLLGSSAPISFEGLRAVEHLLRAAPAVLADRGTVEHRGQLVYPSIIHDLLDGRACPIAIEELSDRKMRIAERGNLRQMRNADDLMLLADAPQFLADDLPSTPADANIDFVEH